MLAMGLGSGWQDVELCHLSRSLKHASEHPIISIEQKTARYFRKIFGKFRSFSPPTLQRKKYVKRSLNSINSKPEKDAADFQKFRESLHLIQALNPTGVNYRNDPKEEHVSF